MYLQTPLDTVSLRVMRSTTLIGRVVDSLEEGLWAGAVLETNRVADLVSKANVHLVGNALGDRHGRHTTRLGAGNLQTGPAEVGKVGVGDVLGDPGRARPNKSAGGSSGGGGRVQLRSERRA